MTTIFVDEGETELERAREETLRSEAIAKGQKTYFTGKPCLWGHIAARRVHNGTCLSCRNMHTARKAEGEGREYKPRGTYNERRTDRMYGKAVGKDNLRG